MPGLDEKRLGTIIDRFYEAAAQPALWRAVLHETSTICGADGALLLAQPASAGVIWSEGIDEAVEAMIRTGWHLRNERMRRATPHMQQARVITESTVFTRWELDHHPFNAELVNPLGMRWYAGLPVANDGDHTIAMSIERRATHEPFSRGELGQIRKLVPHLRRAGALALKLGLSRTEGMLDAFEQMDCGALLLDTTGRVVRLNTFAKAQIGISIQIMKDLLSAACRSADGNLQILIASAIGRRPPHETSACGPVALPRSGLRPVIAHASPIVGSAGDLFQRAKAIVMLLDPDRNLPPTVSLLQQTFELTVAEARLANCLATGAALDETAVALGISYETARTTLKRVFSKVGVSRQSELAVLLTKLSRR